MGTIPKTLINGLLALAVLGSGLLLPVGTEAAAPRSGGNTAELKKIDRELNQLVAAKKKKKKHHHKKHHKAKHHKKHHHKKKATARQLEQQLDNLLNRDLGKKS